MKIMNNYNPDVLSCIANLSSDEVFTSPKIANDMLDLLPIELWNNPEATFLDPCSKSGVFLREITKRLMEGLVDHIPDRQERLDHILKNQVFGISITQLTSFLSRRSLYCSKAANGKYSVTSAFDAVEGNVFFDSIQHTWKQGSCIYCGASQSEYDRDDILETHAYQFIHDQLPAKIQNMKFDVIIGNPPYQLSDGSGASRDAAMPIYNKFIEQAIKLEPRYLTMIIPSKWMVGGRGLKKFRDFMVSDHHIKTIIDFENATDCFPGVHIDGGINYFLRAKEYIGVVDYTYKTSGGTVITSKKELGNNFFEYIVRDNRILSILEKTKEEKKFFNIISNTKPFGIRKFLFNSPERYPDANLNTKPFQGSVKIYGVKGIKGGAKRVEGFISRNIISNNEDAIGKFKLFFTTSYSTNAITPPKTIIAGKNEICTETFLMIGPFETELEQLNCLSYIETNFFKVLLYYGKGTMQVTKSVFGLIPLQDFSESWTDEKLYKKYNLNQEEIDFIESMIRPMN